MFPLLQRRLSRWFSRFSTPAALLALLLSTGLHNSNAQAAQNMPEANAPLPSQPFSEQLDSLVDQANILKRYQLDRLTHQRIEITLWYTGDYQLGSEEVAAFNNGACFAVLKQAFQSGLRPFEGGTDIICHARQQDGDAVTAHILGDSHYTASDSDEFYFESAVTGK